MVEGNGNAARVVAATRLARAAGVRPGLTLPQARALCPKLVARPRDADCERAAQEALLEVAESLLAAGRGRRRGDRLPGRRRHRAPLSAAPPPSWSWGAR